MANAKTHPPTWLGTPEQMILAKHAALRILIPTARGAAALTYARARWAGCCQEWT